MNKPNMTAVLKDGGNVSDRTRSMHKISAAVGEVGAGGGHEKEKESPLQ